MSQSPVRKRFFTEDLEWFVMTPALMEQFRPFYAEDRPIGVVLWASVSEEVQRAHKEGPRGFGHRIRNQATGCGSLRLSPHLAARK